MEHNISAFHKQHISTFKNVELLFLDIFKTFPSLILLGQIPKFKWIHEQF